MAAWPFMLWFNQIMRKVNKLMSTLRSEGSDVPPEKKARLEAGSCPIPTIILLVCFSCSLVCHWQYDLQAARENYFKVCRQLFGSATGLESENTRFSQVVFSHFDQPEDPLEIDSSDEAEHDKGVEADLKDERAFLSPHAQVVQLQCCRTAVPGVLEQHRAPYHVCAAGAGAASEGEGPGRCGTCKGAAAGWGPV